MLTASGAPGAHYGGWLADSDDIGKSVLHAASVLHR